MTYRIAIDPGKLGAAYAIFDGEVLVHAGYVSGHSPETVAHALLWSIPARYRPTSGIVEKPQVYETRQQKGDQNDLIDVAEVVGAIRYALHSSGVSMEEVRPAQWKGQIPKRVTKARVEAELSAIEFSTIQWPEAKLRHNVYDAIHIGLRVFTARKA